jgi:hypothetical protein
MTRWGLLLLITFLGLGLGRTPKGKAITLSVCLTSLVITFVMAKTIR